MSEKNIILKILIAILIAILTLLLIGRVVAKI